MFTKRSEAISGPARRAALACALAFGPALAHAARAQPQSQDTAATAAAEPVRRPLVNTLPLAELAETGRRLVEEGRLGPGTTFHMTLDAEIDEHGGLKPDTVKLAWQTEPDEAVRVLGEALASAVSQSRIFSVLREPLKSIRLTFALDRQNVTLGVTGEAASADEAQRLAVGYGMLLLMGRKQKQGTPVGDLYEAFKIESEGRLFKMSFAMPKGEAARMVADMLSRRAARTPAARQ